MEWPRGNSEGVKLKFGVVEVDVGPLFARCLLTSARPSSRRQCGDRGVRKHSEADLPLLVWPTQGHRPASIVHLATTLPTSTLLTVGLRDVLLDPVLILPSMPLQSFALPTDLPLTRQPASFISKPLRRVSSPIELRA